MEETAFFPLAHWENFYVIVGSSAGALTGLQFVVIALIAETQFGSMGEIRAFGTPTVVHFCAVLLVSAIISAPWHALLPVGFCLGACGAAGVGFILMVIGRARKQTGYKPDAEDWVWHAALPLIGYAELVAAAILLSWRPRSTMFVIAETTLLLLFVGIHNAWDAVTYVALEHRRRSKDAKG